MRIGIEAHAIGMQQGGNERYVEGLLKGFSMVEPEDCKFVVFLNQNASIPSFLEGKKHFEFERVSISPIKRLVYDLPVKIKKAKIDLIHTQYHLPFFTDIPSIITLHDVSYLTHPECFPVKERLKMKIFIPRSIKIARKIITVSQFSKNEILTYYKNAEKKICVIYNGISEKFTPSDDGYIKGILTKFKIRQPYILTVSNLQPRKNLAGLVKSFLRILKEDRNFPCDLVITGKKLWLYDEIFSEVRKSQFSERIIISGYLNDEELVALYSGAEMFVYVSFYEGFGFPPLEAMACGCPVITSSISSLPEIAGDAALLVNPYNENEIVSAIIRLHNDDEIKKQLREKGFKQAKKFSWKQCAIETLQLYRNVGSLL